MVKNPATANESGQTTVSIFPARLWCCRPSTLPEALQAWLSLRGVNPDTRELRAMIDPVH
jgi:hypothetical protein